MNKEINGKVFSYHVFFRKKKNGKLRKITAPCEELKTLQRALAEEFYKLAKDEFSSELTGFLPSRSIFDNAKPHVNKKWVINIDIESFFPNTKTWYVKWALEKVGLTKYGEYDFDDLIEILTLDGGLPQGSPASPIIANYVGIYFVDKIVKHIFDSAIVGLEYDYTRYADDVTISTNSEVIDRNQLKWMVGKVCTDLSETSPYTVAKRKIKITHESQLQQVTGVAVNNGFSISRKERMKIRAMIHHVRLGKREADPQVLGKLNFIKCVNSHLYNKLVEGELNERN